MKIPNLRLGIGFAAVVCVAFLVFSCGGDGGNNDSSKVVFKYVTLSGAQENPAVTTAAFGTGFISVNMETGAVGGTITTFGIAGNAAHIHNGPVGVNAPVIVPLAQGPTGTWTVPANSQLTASQLDSLTAGNLYVNVHTTANSGGEIRAQLGRQVFFSTLTGAQETPPVTTAASGTGRFVFDPDTRVLTGSVTATGITGTAAHLHAGAVGVAAPVAIPMSGGPTEWAIPANTVLTPDQVTTLTTGKFYANVHSAANPGGEIRGQVFTPLRTATLAGANEVPPVTTSATGTCAYFANPFTKGVAGRTETTGINGTAAHAHRAASGVTGPVVIPQTSPSAGVWVTAVGATISDDLLASFMKGDLYCNVHSAANPGGEIRGQLVPAL
jgi:hypothetical protein